MYGVCDVVFYKGDVRTSIGMETADCPIDAEETLLSLPDETPLVGFHGKVDFFGMSSLGLILVDTLDPVCQKPAFDDPNMWIYEAMDDFTAAEQSEGAITGPERARAQALEAILMDESLHNSAKSKEAIRNEIKEMHKWAPISLNTNGVPESIDDLKTVLERLTQLDEEHAPVTKTEMTLVLDQITEFYR